VHLASPFVLGWDAVRAARLLEVPSVAVYQTEVPTYAARYGVGGLEAMLWRRVRDIHRLADLTLAPSRAACSQLQARACRTCGGGGVASTSTGSARSGAANASAPSSVDRRW
jgi:hypothetical protein